MQRQIELQVKLPFKLRRNEDDDIWVANCQVLDVVSQGDSENEAVENLREAVMLFLETCIEMGTLDAMLRESGFHPVAVAEHREHDQEEHWLDVPMELIANNGANAQNHVS